MILSISVALCLIVWFLVLSGLRQISHLCFQNWADQQLPMEEQKWYVKFAYFTNYWVTACMNTTIAVGMFVGAWVIYELAQILFQFA